MNPGEGDEAAIRRPGRIGIRTWMSGESLLLDVADDLDVNIVVVLVITVPGKGDLVAMW